MEELNVRLDLSRNEICVFRLDAFSYRVPSSSL